MHRRLQAPHSENLMTTDRSRLVYCKAPGWPGVFYTVKDLARIFRITEEQVESIINRYGSIYMHVLSWADRKEETE